MKRTMRTLGLILTLALAFAPLLGDHLWIRPADAQSITNQTVSQTFQNAVATTGNGNVMFTANNPIVTYAVSGTFVATVVPEGTIDGTTWSALTCYPLGSSSGQASFTSADTGKLLRCNAIGVNQVRARVSSFTTSGLPSGVTSTSVTVKGFGTQSYFPLGTNTP